MEITFSRHAQRRAKLYKIPESTILGILKGKHFTQGIQEIIEHVEGWQYPLKIIIAIDEDRVSIVSAYPLKRGRKT